MHSASQISSDTNESEMAVVFFLGQHTRPWLKLCLFWRSNSGDQQRLSLHFF